MFSDSSSDYSTEMSVVIPTNISQNTKVFLPVHVKKIGLFNDVYDYDKVPESDKVRHFPFPLDDFQERAIKRVHDGNDVLVAAHTSAGKTVIAEYAIAMAVVFDKHVYYASPIKSLSNQKYKEFSKIFPSVGIITGDTKLNDEAQCIIITAEILLDVLVAGINNVQTIILDEAHFVNDASRGQIWEEIILNTPDSVNLVLLSATFPNYIEFAEWITRTKSRAIYTIHTVKRPTPLQFYLWDLNCSFLVSDEHGFKDNVFSKIYQRRNEVKQLKELRTGKQQPVDDKSVNASASIRNLIQHLTDTDRLPLIIFCFSREQCESLASHLTHTSSKNSKRKVFLDTMKLKIPVNLKNLECVSQIWELASKGIGLHHGGLLPILKEVIELLFSQCLLDILICTETFAMGVNMPARSVLFTSLHKHDGTCRRSLLHHEFIQMSGRAGRRGLDDFGGVYILDLDPLTVTTIFTSKPSNITSKFKMNYKLIILACRSHTNISQYVAQSFLERKRKSSQTQAREQLGVLTTKLENVAYLSCCDGDVYLKYLVELENLEKTLPKCKKKVPLHLCSEFTRAKDLHRLILSHPCTTCVLKEEHVKQSKETSALTDKLKSVHKLLGVESLQLHTEYVSKLTVLNSLEFMQFDILTEKGQIACHLADYSLALVQCIFENVFDKLTESELAAVLTIFICEKGDQYASITPEIDLASERIYTIVCNLQQMEFDNYVVPEHQPSSTYMKATYIFMESANWALVQEELPLGNFARTMCELIELLKKLCISFNALHLSELSTKIQNINTKLILSTYIPSLYLDR